MPDRRITLDILARDRASREIDKVGRAADSAGRDMQDTARAARTLDDQMDQAQATVRRLAVEMAALDPGSARFRELGRDVAAANRQLSSLGKLRKSLGEIKLDTKVDRGGIGGLLGGLGSMGLKAGREAGQGLASGIGTALSASGPIIQTALVAAGVTAAAAAAPAIGAALASGFTLAAGGGVLAGGIAAVAKNPKVTAAAKALGESFLGRGAAGDESIKKLEDKLKAAKERLEKAQAMGSAKGIKSAQYDVAQLNKELDKVKAFNAKNLSIGDLAQPLVDPLVNGLGIFKSELEKLKPQIGGLFKTIAPAVEPLAKGLAGMVTQMIPGLQALTAASVPLFTTLGQKLPLIGAAFTQMFNKIAASGPAMNQFFSDMLTFTAGLIVTLGSVIGWLSTQYATARGAIVATVNGIKAAWDGLVTGFNATVQFLGALPGRIVGFFTGLPSALGGLIRSAGSAMAYAAGYGVGSVIRFFATLPGRVGSLIAATWSRGRALFAAGVSAVASIAATLPGRVMAFVGSLPGRIAGLAGAMLSAGAGIGRAMISGLIGGIRAMAGAVVSAARSVVESAIAGAKAALGIASPSKVFKRIGKYTADGLVQGLTGSKANVTAASRKIAGLIEDAFGGRTEKRLLARASAARTKLTKLAINETAARSKLAAAQKRLADAQKQYADSAQQMADRVRASFQLVGDTGSDNVGQITDRLQRSVDAARKFAGNMAALAKRGLNKGLLEQLAEAGPQAGGATAAALARASSAELKRLNGLAGQLDGYAKSTGKVVADGLYGAGVRAAQGLVRGLNSQVKAIEATMLKIARSMQAAIRKALGIRSPSRVFAQLGEYTMAGYAQGVTAQAGMAQRALTAAMPAPVTPRMPAAATARGAGSAGGSGSAGYIEFGGDREIAVLIRRLIRTTNLTIAVQGT